MIEVIRFPHHRVGRTDVLTATLSRVAVLTLLWSLASPALAQTVGLPAPRLLTTQPMGGKAGTQFEITITGEHLDDADELVFSEPRITATRKRDAAGQPEPNKYLVTIAPDCPVGICEASVMTRLGLSSSRVFSVGTLLETIQKQPNTSVATAQELPMNSVCNAAISVCGVDHYAFQGRQGQRVIVDCATRGIDSKLDAVVIIADASGRDLLVERRGGVLDFAVPADGRYLIKVHELTFRGGPAYFYRLGVWEQPAGTPIVRQPSTKAVNSFSWPPAGLGGQAGLVEAEPNGDAPVAQKIALPCDISGSFFPAADVDMFEFQARKGEEWWVEVASERFGLPTDPTILVQHVARTVQGEKLTDVAEFNDIPSPVRVSSNGYAYDGPPYNAGTADILGKLVIKEDGLHRLQLTDLYGGTRSDPRNIYRLVIRRARPDFALVGWALHMELRNGDRNAVSKPMALRRGATMALEVIAIRRDGFDGDIELGMEGLPEGVTARGLKIPAGQSRGLLLVSARQDATRGFANARFYGRAQIHGVPETRTVQLASMTWPVPDAASEIPVPRLLGHVPVSVGGFEVAPLTISPVSDQVLEVAAGQKLTIPLKQVRRSEFSGATMEVRTMGAGFERVPVFNVPLTADSTQAVLDLAALKTPPGDYLIAFYGGAVAKYCHRLDMVSAAEETRRKAEQEVTVLKAEARKLTEAAPSAPANQQADAQKAVQVVSSRLIVAETALTSANDQLKKAMAAAQPNDIVDIVVSEPIAIRVKPAETK